MAVVTGSVDVEVVGTIPGGTGEGGALAPSDSIWYDWLIGRVGNPWLEGPTEFFEALHGRDREFGICEVMGSGS